MASTSNQQPDVVQAIFDSITRCFNPLDDESPFSNRCPRESPETDSTNATRRSPSNEGSSASRKQQLLDLKQQYDADRYIHRKLEIFRTTDEDLAELGIERRPKKTVKKQQPTSSR
mmetsp:Transcript_23712/g.51299  ORF Transcript_23712/g.51299 Transcript_23712/m.51299 type:complete len:116 (-) Transcript_23712:910-1257(-)